MKNFSRRARKALKKTVSALKGRRGHVLFCALCVAAIVLAGAYALFWQHNRSRIEQDSAYYRQLYSPAPIVSSEPAAASSSPHAETSTLETADSDAGVEPLDNPSPAAALASSEPSASNSAISPAEKTMEAPTPEPTLEPLATPDEDTVILSLPTAPPTQESFTELLRYNPETVGYLTIGETISLPVAQRINDNEFYLSHNFEGEESLEGALFLDGANRLTPGDQNLIVYGHNMKNGTMFGNLWKFGELEFLKENAVIRFDTIYENALYVPFAMFAASMDPDDSHYFEVRQIAFDETEFELFVLSLKVRSEQEIPVDVEYGDEILTLVTCSSSDADGRYIVALRKLRPGETEQEMRETIAQVE